MNIAILTSVYPGAEEYFPEFLESLDQQTYTGFDLIIANDAMPNLSEFVAKYNVQSFVTEGSGTPVQLRKAMIKFALTKNYDWFVFLDADDTATPNRMAKLRKFMEQDKNSILINDLCPFGECYGDQASLLSEHFKDGDIISIDALIDGNILGLSNTAAKSETIKKYFEAPDDSLTAYDWALFSLALKDGEVARYTSGAATNYRQHGNNVAPFTNGDLESLVNKLSIKESHYKFMATKYPEYATLLNQTHSLHNRLQSDQFFADQYLHAANETTTSTMPLWWRTPKMSNDQ